MERTSKRQAQEMKKQSNYGSFDEAILLLHLPSVFSPGLQCNTMVKVACFDALIW